MRIRSIISSRRQVISCMEIRVQTRKTAAPASMARLPRSSTTPVRARVMRGISMPTRVTSSVSPASSSRSPALRQLFRYSSRSGMPSFFCGSGR